MFVPGQSDGPAVTAYVFDSDPGWDSGWHVHERAQLVYAESGLLRCETAEGTWLTPPSLAVWIPAGREHRLTGQGPVKLRFLYLRPALWPEATACRVLQVAPLLRALVLRACAPEEGEAAERRLAVLLDELRAAAPAGLHLAPGRDRRLRRVTEALLADPADGRSLAGWGRGAGASGRTLARLFVAETGLTFAQWRQRARLLAALARLAEGRPVGEVALDLGYAGPSAFIQAFRRAFGITPARWRAGRTASGDATTA